MLRRQLNSILCPSARQVRWCLRHLHDIPQSGVISLGHALTGLDLVRKYPEFLDQYCGLNRVEASVHPDPHIVIFVGSLPVYTQAPQHGNCRIIIEKDRTAIAVTSERLRRKKAGGRQISYRTDLVALIAGPKALRGVADHPHTLR